ncbi:MAG: flavohemoglobin expression-modulating QEGLA motif protein [Candidatus Poribacteria bacterium]|nr:flavohemoglobin expression-modulating QEGLA motif protein [Candidatus Poribacteria bacterium]
MEDQSKASNKVISDRFIRTVCSRLAENKQVRRTLPDHGRLHIDRQLPFLCVYRYPPRRKDAGTERLVIGQPSYLIASGDKQTRESLSKLIQNIVQTLSREFGAFLILEIWSSGKRGNDLDVDTFTTAPEFRITAQSNLSPFRTVETLAEALRLVRVRKQTTTVKIARHRKIAPLGLPALLPNPVLKESGCALIGLEVHPIYRSPETDEVFPIIRRLLAHEITGVLQKTFFQFSRTQTTHRPTHFHVLGRRAVVKAVWKIDTELAEISNAFDFLLQVTPINTESAYASFRRSHFERTPVFYYRPQPFDAAMLKRKLWNTRLESIEDPTLGYLFREKRYELDIQLTMLSHIDTPRFFHGSLQLFGGVEDELLELAEKIVEQVPSHSRERGSKIRLDATAFAKRVEEELQYYRQQLPEFSANAEIRDDIYTGLMVSKGNLLIGKKTRISDSRADALIQHEVGTHILTYFNGRAQPFQMLYTGLAGYEEMQEGLAVLSEYLVGGLSLPRLRLLAARVIAARCLIDGASFIETFQILKDTYSFTQRTAFTVTMRVYRSGGLIKDAVYLRGLVGLLDYLKKGGALEPLFVGKIAAEHIPIIQELQWRKVLKSAPLRPRYMEHPNIEEKFNALRKGLSVLDFIKKEKK